MAPAINVRHNPAARRYEVDVDGQLAVADYVLEEGRQVFTHTFVPAAARGLGVAEALVRTALDDALAARRRVVPACSYVARFIDRNPQYRGLLGG